MKQILFITIFLIGVTLPALGQKAGDGKSQASETKPTSELYNEIARMDGVLFDAFNSQNLEKMKTLFTEDLEFYHDKDGLILYAQTIESFKKLFDQNLKLRRELVKGSLEVYPLKDYGAIEAALHTFCHLENGKNDCGTFKFVHIWRKKDGEWKISRIVSYNH